MLREYSFNFDDNESKELTRPFKYLKILNPLETAGKFALTYVFWIFLTLPILAMSLLWVIITSVWLNYLIITFKRSITSSVDFESRFPVGLSANIKDGLLTKTRANETLCCCPSESSFGNLFDFLLQVF